MFSFFHIADPLRVLYFLLAIQKCTGCSVFPLSGLKELYLEIKKVDYTDK